MGRSANRHECQRKEVGTTSICRAVHGRLGCVYLVLRLDCSQGLSHQPLRIGTRFPKAPTWKSLEKLRIWAIVAVRWGWSHPVWVRDSVFDGCEAETWLHRFARGNRDQPMGRNQDISLEFRESNPVGADFG